MPASHLEIRYGISNRLELVGRVFGNVDAIFFFERQNQLGLFG